MLTHARAPSSRGKHSGRITTSVITVMTSRRSARMLSAPEIKRYIAHAVGQGRKLNSRPDSQRLRTSILLLVTCACLQKECQHGQ